MIGAVFVSEINKRKHKGNSKMEVIIKKATKVSPFNKTLGGNDLVRGAILDFPDSVANSLIETGIAESIEKKVESKVITDIETKVITDIETKTEKPKRKRASKKTTKKSAE